MLEMIAQTLAAGIIAAQILIVIIIVLVILQKLKLSRALQKVQKFLGNYQYTLLFFTSLGSLIGSLFFSDILKLPPCTLCWYQRIFMYAQFPLLYLAIIRKEYVLKPYLLTLNIIGAIIALYHLLIIYLPSANFINCEATGISCSTVQVLYFGYISIPVMSLTIFTLNILLLLFFSQKPSKK